LNETSEDLGRNRAHTKTQSAPRMVPQWLLEFLRPLIGWLCHMLWQVEFRGTENIPKDGGLIVASNHQTYLDPFWVSIPIARPLRYLAWSEAFGWPLAGPAMRVFGAWPLQLERGDPKAIRRTLQWLSAGGAMVIFPEGGRGKPDGSMLKFKPGAVRMSLEAEVPILPVTIRGGNRIWPSNRRLPRLGKVEVTFHPLHAVKCDDGEEPRDCARRESDRLAEVIGSAL
jgi:1-acyl-sn-glycerol-3-phosphate acyltransferase